MLVLAGRPTPSVACIVQPGSNGGFQKVFFGDEEIAIPVYGRCVYPTLLCTLAGMQQQRPYSGKHLQDVCQLQQRVCITAL
jgi:hypothetical protein